MANELNKPSAQNGSTAGPSPSGGAGEMMIRIGKLLAILFLFLISLKLMGSSFKLFGKGLAEDLVNITTNPFISLFIGMLATAVIQSSSTTTSSKCSHL